MSDLTFSQGTDPVSVFNDTSGNQLIINSDGSINTMPSLSIPQAASISNYVSNNQTYTVALDINMTVAGADNPLLLIKNPSGSGKVLFLYKVAFAVTVQNTSGLAKLYGDPTITLNGTSVTSQVNNFGDSQPASQMNAFQLPTISVLGARMASYYCGQNSNSVSAVEDMSIHIQPGHSILLTGNPSSNNRLGTLTIIWVEV